MLVRHHAHFASLLFLLATFPEVPPRSPFVSQASHVPLHGSVVSNPFTTSLPKENNTVASNRGPPLPGAGPVRLARFLEMLRDQYYATVNAMITPGRFNHICEASVRLEAQTAWGVWLRIDHWRASRGASRLRCGVLYHRVNLELTFHGVASVVAQFLLPLFADWTFASAELLPSVRPTTSHEPFG